MFKIVKSQVKFLKALSSLLLSSKAFIFNSAILVKQVSIDRRRSVPIVVLETKSSLEALKVIKKALIEPGIVFTLWDATDATLTLLNPDHTPKDKRDAYATFFFIGTESISSLILTAGQATPGVNFLITLAWLTASLSYSGFSLVYEYKDENLTFMEFYNTFSRGFWQAGLDYRIQQYIDHRTCHRKKSNE